jgi:hypothetical protein
LSIATVLGVALFGADANASSMVGKIKADIRSLELAVQAYWLDHGQYPAEFGGLIGNYTYQIPKDPWGRNYHYSIYRPEISSKDGSFHVWTLGRDGKIGGDDLESIVAALLCSSASVRRRSWSRPPTT